MYPSKKLITSLAVLAVLVGCDDADKTQQEAQKPPPPPPADFYAPPPAPPPPPPPRPARLEAQASVAFPTLNLAERKSARVTIALRNSGELPTTMQAVAITGTTEVATVRDCRGELPAGQTCSLEIEWRPTRTANLDARIVAASTSNSLEIELTGAAYEPPPPPPPPPPAPPPGKTAEQLRAEHTAERLRARMKNGPLITDHADQNELVAKVDYRLTDKDYTREQSPGTTSSFPVDRNFILTMERNVNAVLLREVNSQLPGVIQAMVTQDIFGTDGRHRLLERGDVWLGKYKPLEKQGDTRLNVCFFRIIRLADGAHIYDSGDQCFAIATDAMGRTGLTGDVDNRTWERYGTAFLTAGLSALAAASVNASAGTQNQAVTNSGNALSQNLGQVTARVIEENINLAPILTVAQGERINIQLLRDLYLRRPEPIVTAEKKQ